MRNVETLVKMAAVLAIGLGTPALAQGSEYEVMSSNVAAYPIGTVLSARARIALPEDGRLTLIYRTGEKVETRQCGGQYEGPVEACSVAGANKRSPAIGGGMRGVSKKQE